MNPKAFLARKRFGQNFLQDKNVIAQIIRAIHPQLEDDLVEIGPGLAAITAPILSLPEVRHLHAIEIDRDLATKLNQQFDKTGKFTLHSGDALEFDFTALHSDKLKIFGNLPYNISTPLLFHLSKYTSIIQSMHFMLQKEVVNRLTASPNSKDYGRLTVMMQYFCQSTALFDIQPSSFIPQPKVISTFVRLIPHSVPPYPVKEFSRLQTIVTAAFNQRRKTISNALKAYLSHEDFTKLHIAASRRAETLSLKDFVDIANYLSQKS